MPGSSQSFRRTTRSMSMKNMNPRQVLTDVFSGVGSSCSSSVSSNARSRLAIAQLNEKQAEERHRLECQELEMKRQREVLEARQEVEMAKLELDFEDEETSLGACGTYDRNRVEEFVKTCHKDPDRPIEKVSNTSIPHQAGFEGSILNALQSLRMGHDLPKVELSPFDGTPAGYWNFIRQFQYHIENKVADDGQRLLYLINYCRGVAKLAIKECIMLPPDKGYAKAKLILKQRFGQPHQVARALLDELFSSVRDLSSSSEALTSLADKMESCSIALSEMNYLADLDSLATIERIVSHLPRTLQYQWADYTDKVTNTHREPSFADLLTFVSDEARVSRSRFRQLAELQGQPKQFNQNVTRPNNPMPERPRSFVHTVVSGTSSSCDMCQGAHHLRECPRFKALNSSERWLFVKENKTCFKCLSNGHQLRQCYSRTTCNVGDCNSGHHPLLHESPRNINQGTMDGLTRTTLLGIIPVRVFGSHGSIVTHALLDNGSDTTLMTNSLAQKLGLKGKAMSVSLNGVIGTRHLETQCVSTLVRPLYGDEEVHIDSAICLERIPVNLPKQRSLDVAKEWPHLADVEFQTAPGEEIGILIGCDVPEAHWVLDQRLGTRKQPYAIKTRLGWMLLGPLSMEEKKMLSVNCLHRPDPPIIDLVEKMYNREFTDIDLDISNSIEDSRVLELVQKQTVMSNGKYVVPLPWRDSSANLLDNRKLVIQRACLLKRRLLNNNDYHQKYVKVMEQTIEKGYAVQVPSDQLLAEFSPRYYIPHHGVINPKKPEKIRIVLDCAAEYRGVSLNDHLLQGPDLTNELVLILMGFRTYPVAVTADVEEMFMQVKVPEHDVGALRFLWWSKGDLTEEAVEYQMTSHPFGAKSSPFCATYALRRTALDFGEHFDADVSESVNRDFYVDDYLSSMPNIDEARRVAPQIHRLLSKGGFRLRKWLSNYKEVLEELPESEKAETAKHITDEGKVDRMLGIEWDAKTDMFTIRMSHHESAATRRGILSALASIYDPLGILAPIVLPARILLQKLCKDGFGWDTLISKGDYETWTKWKQQTESISPVNFPRCIGRRPLDYNSELQIHVFCDASETGYGAAVYVRFIPKDDTPYCTLLIAKSRVAPLKPVTIPRLELNAAVLSIRLNHMVTKSMRIKFSSVNYWTDSAIVLHYLHNESKRFNTFVANRVTSILEHSDKTQWRHVRSKENPADLASRGINTPEELKFWLNGPAFLRDVTTEWCNTIPGTDLSRLEWKRKATVCVSNQDGGPIDSVLTKFSSWLKLLRVVAWVKRFVDILINRCRANGITRTAPATLQTDELEEARIIILKSVQSSVYNKEISILSRSDDSTLNVTSQIYKLCPMLREGILRVGGRLALSSLDDDVKYPAILPSRHHVVDLIIQHFHCMEGHSGPGHVLSCIRRKYWIVHGGRAVRRALGSCIQCKRRFTKPCEQQMAPLPTVRTEPGLFPFEHTGVDYFGPFLVKRGRTHEKRFGCIFTCMKTRAVHLEMAYDLSTDGFLTALSRFVGRRGCPTHIYSDNGTNFVGARKELKATLTQWDQGRIANTATTQGIQWHFNPASCSHRGGVWERLIRSARRILCGISSAEVFTDESLSTLLVQVERIMNSRPIVSETSNHDDPTALTPNDLLFVHRAKLEIDPDSLRHNYTKRWRHAMQLAAAFWKRWRNEYLQALQLRQKWEKKKRSLRKGDLVLVCNEGSTRNNWPLGIVAEVKQSEDGLVRSVAVRTARGVTIKDVRSICRLEGDD